MGPKAPRKEIRTSDINMDDIEGPLATTFDRRAVRCFIIHPENIIYYGDRHIPNVDSKPNKNVCKSVAMDFKETRSDNPNNLQPNSSHCSLKCFIESASR